MLELILNTAIVPRTGPFIRALFTLAVGVTALTVAGGQTGAGQLGRQTIMEARRGKKVRIILPFLQYLSGSANEVQQQSSRPESDDPPLPPAPPPAHVLPAAAASALLSNRPAVVFCVLENQRRK